MFVGNADTIEDGEKTEDVIASLYEAHRKSLCKAAFSRLGDYCLSEEAVQETFIIALRFREKLYNCKEPLGWLYRALQFAVLEIRRRENRYASHHIPIEDIPFAMLAKQDYYSEIETGTAVCREMQLLWEHYCCGYTIREMSFHYAISTGACKMRLKRARDTMREKIGA